MMEAKDFTFAEMADIHFFYGRANGNAHEARRLYQETFPNRRLPCSQTFSRNVCGKEANSFPQFKDEGLGLPELYSRSNEFLPT